MKKYAAMLMVLALAGCSGEGVDVTTPSSVHLGKIEVRSETATAALDAAKIDRETVAVLARKIVSGGGPASLTAPYHAGGQIASAKAAQAYAAAFAAEGAPGVTVSPILVAADVPADKIILSYKTFAASPDSSCRDMPAMDGGGTLKDGADYQFRCTLQSAQSRMIADPNDLFGHGGSRDGDSRRAGAMVEKYGAGTPNQPMQGLSASDIGKQN